MSNLYHLFSEVLSSKEKCGKMPNIMVWKRNLFFNYKWFWVSMWVILCIMCCFAWICCLHISSQIWSCHGVAKIGTHRWQHLHDASLGWHVWHVNRFVISKFFQMFFLKKQHTCTRLGVSGEWSFKHINSTWMPIKTSIKLSIFCQPLSTTPTNKSHRVLISSLIYLISHGRTGEKHLESLTLHSLGPHGQGDRGEPTFHMGNGWVGPYNPRPMRFFWGVKLFLRVWLKRCQMKTQLTMNKIFWIWKWSFPTSKSHLQSFQPIELRDAFEFLDLVDLSLDQSNSICCPPWNQQFAPKKPSQKEASLQITIFRCELLDSGKGKWKLSSSQDLT